MSTQSLAAHISPRNGIKEYIAEVFLYALGQQVTT